MGSGYDWFRFYNRMIMNPKTQMLSDGAFRLLVGIWCFASDSKERGWVRGWTIDALCRVFNCTIDDPEKVCKTLVAHGWIKMHSVADIEVIDWERWQYDHPSDVPSRRKRGEHAECLRSERGANAEIDTDTDTEVLHVQNAHDAHSPKRGTQPYSEDFEVFWKDYPRKVNKRRAVRCWTQTLKRVPLDGLRPAAADLLIAAARAYARERRGQDEKYTMHPSTFLGPDEPWRERLEVREKPNQPLMPPLEELIDPRALRVHMGGGKPDNP